MKEFNVTFDGHDRTGYAFWHNNRCLKMIDTENHPTEDGKQRRFLITHRSAMAAIGYRKERSGNTDRVFHHLRTINGGKNKDHFFQIRMAYNDPETGKRTNTRHNMLTLRGLKILLASCKRKNMATEPFSKWFIEEVYEKTLLPIMYPNGKPKPLVVKPAQEATSTTDLVRVDANNNVIVDSLMIAKRVNRTHGSVLTSIRNLKCSDEFFNHNFREASYIDKKGQKQVMYIMTRKGCVFLITRMTGQEAATINEGYVTAFAKKSRELRDQIKQQAVVIEELQSERQEVVPDEVIDEEPVEAVSSSRELVPVTVIVINHEQCQTCNARELWECMEVKWDFSSWIKKRLNECLAVEGIDFLKEFTAPEVTGAGNRGRKIEYHITLDTAKHIAMLERTEQGYIVRNHFIEAEKKWKRGEVNPAVPNQNSDHLLVEAMSQIAKMVVDSTQSMGQSIQALLKSNQESTRAILEAISANKDVQPPSHMTVLGYAAMIDLRVDLQTAKNIGLKSSRLCQKNQQMIQSVYDIRYGHVNAYPIDILAKVFGSMFRLSESND